MKFLALLLFVSSTIASADVRLGDTVIRKQVNLKSGSVISVKVMHDKVTELLPNGDYEFEMRQLHPFEQGSMTITIPAENSNYSNNQHKIWMADCESLGGVRVMLTIDSKQVETCKETIKDTPASNPAVEIYHAILPKNSSAKVVWYDNGQPYLIESVEAFEFGN